MSALNQRSKTVAESIPLSEQIAQLQAENRALRQDCELYLDDAVLHKAEIERLQGLLEEARVTIRALVPW